MYNFPVAQIEEQLFWIKATATWEFHIEILFFSIHSEWSGEPNNQTADTDCVNINYGGYYEVNKCSIKYGFICQRPVGPSWRPPDKQMGMLLIVILLSM